MLTIIKLWDTGNDIRENGSDGVNSGENEIVERMK